jgi:hypothetical protein
MAWRTSLFKFNRKSGFFICLPLTIRFQSPVGGATNVTAEAFSKQAQDVVPTFSRQPIVELAKKQVSIV